MASLRTHANHTGGGSNSHAADSDVNAESIQNKISLARRDAEALKDRIKRKKDDLADTTRECSICPSM